jgi:hypothetical protein
LRAKIILACEREPSNAAVATWLGVARIRSANGATASSPIAHAPMERPWVCERGLGDQLGHALIRDRAWPAGADLVVGPLDTSWLNQVERFFALITQGAIRRGSFVSTADFVKKIDRFTHAHNAKPRPFAWTATADSILQKLARLCQRISGTEH